MQSCSLDSHGVQLHLLCRTEVGSVYPFCRLPRTSVFADRRQAMQRVVCVAQRGRIMQQAIPERLYSADERATRARGAAIAFIALATIGAVSIAGVTGLMVALVL